MSLFRTTTKKLLWQFVCVCMHVCVCVHACIIASVYIHDPLWVHVCGRIRSAVPWPGWRSCDSRTRALCWLCWQATRLTWLQNTEPSLLMWVTATACLALVLRGLCTVMHSRVLNWNQLGLQTEICTAYGYLKGWTNPATNKAKKKRTEEMGSGRTDRPLTGKMTKTVTDSWAR